MIITKNGSIPDRKFEIFVMDAICDISIKLLILIKALLAERHDLIRLPIWVFLILFEPCLQACRKVMLAAILPAGSVLM